MGCGGTDMTTDLGTTPQPDLAGAHLQSGTYNISAATAVNDGCMLGVPMGTTQVTNTGTMLSLGKKYDSTTTPQFNPPGYGLGTGAYTSSTTATLTGSEMVTFTDGCTETRSDTTTVTFTGMNMLMVDWQHTESNVSATTCTDTMNDPPVAGCMSEFKFTLSM
jgi:hypothetical protein